MEFCGTSDSLASSLYRNCDARELANEVKNRILSKLRMSAFVVLEHIDVIHLSIRPLQSAQSLRNARFTTAYPDPRSSNHSTKSGSITPCLRFANFS